MADYENTNYLNKDVPGRFWMYEDIVTAAGQVDKYVPKVNDFVLSWDQGFFKVIDIEPGTNVAILKPWSPPSKTNDDDDKNKLVGVGPGYTSESYRCFLDTSVTPFILQPSSRLHYYGSMVDHYLVFKGTNTDRNTGKIISAYYDQSNNYLGPAIPLEYYNETGATDNTTSVPKPGFTHEKLMDSEVVTVVAYDDQGGVIDIAKLLIQNTAVIRQPDQSKKYVSAISIDTPWLSASDPKVIEFPMNVLVDSLPMQGLVHYRGGEVLRLGLGGPQMHIEGLENYIATVEGEEFPMTLTYRLAEDEISYNITPTAKRVITENYIARTAPVDGAYSCRMFVYPNWINATQGYELQFWLYNADRQRFYNVTPYVDLGVNSAPYRPKAYGEVQTLTFAVNLNQVDGRFAPYRFVTTFQIALLNTGESNPNWEVYPRPDTGEGYGRDLKAEVDYIQTNVWDLRLANGANTQEEWLNKMYFKAEPLVNTATEQYPPTPTHFVLHFTHNKYEFSVDQWSDTLKVNNDLKNGNLLNIQWINRQFDTDLQLAMTALPINQISGP